MQYSFVTNAIKFSAQIDLQNMGPQIFPHSQNSRRQKSDM